MIEPFQVAVPDADLADLHERLDRTRWPHAIPGTGWDYGTDLGYLRELCDYWRHRFDWRAAERRINAFPQFRTTIDDVDLHFLHVRSPEPDATPLLMSHGWPGSIVEFLSVLGPLTDPVAHGGRAEDAFHVVAPSLPGYGFSAPPAVPGWGPRRIAAAFAELMARLGYHRYGLQGGDWGCIISPHVALLDPGHAFAMHLNGVIVPRPRDQVELTPDEEAVHESYRRWRRTESGYQAIQATKPLTVGYGLTDSPAGLAGWLAEKFRAWTDCDGVIENAVSRDELLTNISVYWFTGTIGSSARLYYEGMRQLPRERVEAPTGVAEFPKEISMVPRPWAERAFRVVRWTPMPAGGHFAALEQPEALVADIRAFYREL
jgi:microsomal epoxide hydrolase